MENKQLNLSEPENIMGTMDVNPLLIKLSIPMMISMLVQALYNVVDSIFVARVSENALTAVSLAFSLQNMMFAVGIGTGVGVNALLSKSLGEKNQSRANKTAENGLFLALCSYLVFLVLGLTVVRPYFYAQTADADIAEQGIRYLTICCVLSLGMFMQVMNEKLLAATSRRLNSAACKELARTYWLERVNSAAPTASEVRMVKKRIPHTICRRSGKRWLLFIAEPPFR